MRRSSVFGAVVNSYVSSHSGSSDPNLEHLSAGILEPAINDVYLVTVFITLTLVAVAFLMPTRVTEPDNEPDTEPDTGLLTGPDTGPDSGPDTVA